MCTVVGEGVGLCGLSVLGPGPGGDLAGVSCGGAGPGGGGLQTTELVLCAIGKRAAPDSVCFRGGLENSFYLGDQEIRQEALGAARAVGPLRRLAKAAMQ